MSLWRKLLRGSAGIPEPPAFLDEPFEPRNELEHALVAGRADALHEALARARVFVPSVADVSAMGEGDDYRPIILDYDAGPCVAALSSADRLKGLLSAVPGVQSGIDVEASWVLARCPPGVGLALNPGWREGAVLSAADVAALARDGYLFDSSSTRA